MSVLIAKFASPKVALARQRGFIAQFARLVHRLARDSVDNLTAGTVEITDQKFFAKLTLDSSTIKVWSTGNYPTFSKEIVAKYQM